MGFVGGGWDGAGVGSARLREWRGVKAVAAPSGVAISTRLWTSVEDERVLDVVAEHLGGLRRADLASVCRPQSLPADLDNDALRQARRLQLNTRKAALTAQSSARWANAIMSTNDEQYRLARDAQNRYITSLRTAIATIEKRLTAPTGDTLTVGQRKARREAKSPRGYATQSERFAKQRRLQHLRGELARVEVARAESRVRVVEGSKRLAKTRHHLEDAGLSAAQWRDRWEAARHRITAKGSGDEPFGNLTITVTPDGQLSVRLPKPLEHLANAQRGRYILSGRAVFIYRGDEWVARITGGKSVSYTITRTPGRAGRYLTAAWGLPASLLPTGGPDETVLAAGPIVGVDLNDGHLALRRLDAHGNPVGAPERIDIDLTGSSARRDAQVRHAVTRLIRYTRRHQIGAVAVEDLDFADARATGRETMGRGRRGKRFRRSVAGIPTAVFRNRLAGQAAAAGVQLFAVNPAYSSVCGATGIGEPPMRTSPDTRPRPR